MYMTHGACEKIESHSFLGACHCTNIFALIGHLFSINALIVCKLKCFYRLLLLPQEMLTLTSKLHYNTIHMFDTMHNAVHVVGLFEYCSVYKAYH